MSSLKFHVGKNGPGECHAKIKCRLGGESGNDNHYPTYQEAYQVYEKKLENELGKEQKPLNKKSAQSIKKAKEEYNRSVSEEENLKKLIDEYKNDLQITRDEADLLDGDEKSVRIEGYISKAESILKDQENESKELKKDYEKLVKSNKTKRYIKVKEKNDFKKDQFNKERNIKASVKEENNIKEILSNNNRYLKKAEENKDLDSIKGVSEAVKLTEKLLSNQEKRTKKFREDLQTHLNSDPEVYDAILEDEKKEKERRLADKARITASYSYGSSCGGGSGNLSC